MADGNWLRGRQCGLLSKMQHKKHKSISAPGPKCNQPGSEPTNYPAMAVLKYLAIIVFGLHLSQPGLAQQSLPWQLVWQDEFNHNGKPDTANWNYEKGFVRNEELQWYQEDNAFSENGLLVIEARKTKKRNPNYVQGDKNWRKNRRKIYYTSSCLITRGKQQWLYGRFEIKARIGISNGLWPAWWTLGVSKSWPANGEIDIMEYYRGKILANMACLGADKRPQWFSNTFSTDSLGGKQWAAQFHTWRMDWSADSILLYMDDVLLIGEALDKMANKDGSGFNPFRQPHYMLLNLAVGGQNGGDPRGTKFPNRLEIDYVRVYQKQAK